ASDAQVLSVLREGEDRNLLTFQKENLFGRGVLTGAVLRITPTVCAVAASFQGSLISIMSSSDRCLPSPGSNLRNRLHFPAFRDCAHEMLLDTRYYGDDGGFPLKHWCFLGEIVDADFLGRLVVHARDIDGRITRIAFYDEEDPLRGRQFIDKDIVTEKRKCKVGYTVAYLYPVMHNFIDGSMGFRLEDVSDFTIIPLSLSDLFRANDKLHAPVPTHCWQPSCNVTDSLSTCSKCRVARYCGKEHQVKHWKAHKKGCKAFEALKWFTDRDWTAYTR
ncbi:unnamed protein product, partial [Somion occarium]